MNWYLRCWRTAKVFINMPEHSHDRTCPAVIVGYYWRQCIVSTVWLQHLLLTLKNDLLCLLPPALFFFSARVLSFLVSSLFYALIVILFIAKDNKLFFGMNIKYSGAHYCLVIWIIIYTLVSFLKRAFPLGFVCGFSLLLSHCAGTVLSPHSIIAYRYILSGKDSAIDRKAFAPQQNVKWSTYSSVQKS